MILGINTIQDNNSRILVTLEDHGLLIMKKTIKAEYRQSEKLLATIEKVLQSNKLTLRSIDGIKVSNSGGSFTSLRVGILTANALGYALHIPVMPWDDNHKIDIKSQKINKSFDIVKPSYSSEPNINLKN